MKKHAESVISSQVDEHEISKQAYEKADSIMARAKAAESEMILGTYDYIDEVVGQIQAALVDTMIKTEEHFSKLDDYVKQQVKMFDDNREELKRNGEKFLRLLKNKQHIGALREGPKKLKKYQDKC